MCGIVGMFHRDRDQVADSHLLRRMNATIAHRGPDDHGIFIDGPLGFGHRRLSVIDLKSGHQPMLDNDRGRVIVYNGEIYNFRELRGGMHHGATCSFETDCDTEVVLKLAEFESVAWLEKLNGMFAFAIWDARKRKLILARDRLGIKPLYYVHLGDVFLFASEIKALFLYSRVNREVNVGRLPEYLAFRAVAGVETMFDGIYEVPPGHAMTISQDSFEPRIRAYWTEGDNRHNCDYADPGKGIERQFDDIMAASVRYRLISDVPFGSYNSGGVDSSLVTSIMRSMTDGELHTFSVGFEEKDYDERRYARIVADHLGTNHHTLVVDEQQYLDNLETTLWHLEEPINHAHTVQLLLLSRLAKEYVTVILTGEGADELFGGYPRLQIPILSRYLSMVPRIISKAVLKTAEAMGRRKLVKLMENVHDVRRSVIENSRYVPASDMDTLVDGSIELGCREQMYDRSRWKGRSFMGGVLHFDQRTYLPSLLNRLDKVSMASALECRVPFLDVNLVEWSYDLPDRWKMRIGRANKYIVKQAAEKWLPKEIVYREKVGFGTPVGEWFRNPQGLGRYLDLLTDSTFRSRGYFDAAPVEKIVDEHLARRKDHSEALWGLMNIELWCRTFIDASDFLPDTTSLSQQAV